VASLAQSASEQPASDQPAVDQSAAPAAVDAPGAPTDTRTGDLFAGTVAAAPPVTVVPSPAAAPAPAERVDGIA